MKSSLTLNQIKAKWLSTVPEGQLPKEVSVDLLSAALEARQRAYAPYSSFNVGAAVLTEDGQTFTGSNVENASYGATICAERAAVLGAVSAGHRSVRAVAVVADYPTPIPPCGMCRQVIAEFGRDAVVLMSNTDGEVAIESLETLLPSAFEFHKTGQD